MKVPCRADERDLEIAAALQIGDGSPHPQRRRIQEPADHGDVIKIAGSTRSVVGRHLDAAARSDQMPGIAEHLPIGQLAARPVGLVAGEPKRIDEQREGRERKGSRQDEADLQPAFARSIL